MKNRNLLIGGAVALVIVIAGGAWLYNWVLGDTLEASSPIEATPIKVEESVSDETEANDSGTIEDVSTEESAASEETGGGLAIFRISQADSEVRFNIFEELRGEPITVIGVSNQVGGEIAVDLNDLGVTEVGVIQVNARTLVTDADRRNQAIRNRILNTDQHEFITFTPTEVSGLSGSAAPGDEFTFQITGDLTIRDITQTATFDASAKAVSENQISGSAVTIISREAYGLRIPNVSFVANVGEEVTLEIDFVADAVQ